MARYKEKKKATGKVILIAVIAALVLFGGGFYFFAVEGSVTLNETVNVTIAEGSGSKTIAKVLKENGLITSEIGFLLYLRKEDAATKLRPGDYSFGPGKVSTGDVLEELLVGNLKANTIDITIPEGLNILQTADVFVEKGLVTREEFLDYAANIDIPYDYIPKGTDYNQLEGFLFPDTYNIGENWGAKEIIDKMLEQFDKNWTDDRQKRADDLQMTVKEVVTLASLVERETLFDAERPVVAGVIYNRLNADMLLQIDATIQYILGEQKDRILYSDLEIESPYNTYQNKGLPPGPIASPGIASIDGTLDPAPSAYLYYQTKKEGNGEHYFCETYEEHMAYKNSKN